MVVRSVRSVYAMLHVTDMTQITGSTSVIKDRRKSTTEVSAEQVKHLDSRFGGFAF